MITLEQDRLAFSFPDVHEDAHLNISFLRTLRIPDDGRTYPLPPGLGRFPLRHVDDFAERVPANWRPRGGIMLPMFQSEALWISFGRHGYPFAVKVATGKINAVDGKPWMSGLARAPQNYLVVPPQPWLDGYCVEKGVIRQFVAMPLGAGYTVEEQVTGEAEHGGIQIVAYPMKRALYEEMQRKRHNDGAFLRTRAMFAEAPAAGRASMGLAPGGRMRQHIYDDERGIDAWDQAHSSRCFIAIANSLSWRAITGEAPPSLPPTARDYAKAKLPWFDYYADAPAVEGAGVLKDLLSVVGMGKKKGEAPLPENESADAGVIVPLGPAKPGPRRVREAALE